MNQKQQILSNMYAFAIAGKSLSFTKAGEELFITQGAVSQRIKCLEKQLGFSLFVRLTRRLELTNEGARLLQALNQSFDVIFSELDDIKFNELRGELYIGAAPTFAQRWILERLSDFQQRYPNLNIKLRVKASRLDFQHEPVDIAIYYSNIDHPGFYHQRLFDEVLVPICSPDYFKEHFTTNELAATQLSNSTFIHCTESLEGHEPAQEWSVWLAAQDDKEIQSLDIMKKAFLINHSDMAMIAARNGLGIGIARKSLVQEYLKNGDLIAPFSEAPSGLGYDLICLQGQQDRPKISAFIDWVLSQVRMLDT
ncbi:LysR substrate-binding domain-containing protein [Vibrio aestuarianus]|uniref:LysR substrate-binding domain-containing protein n=1 Tax=Vibrio aestuarianus TaxID=28171 RepID=UPI0021C342EF|nr:LysR substrate-binding domain-containing protein [Vibrio aestuarianus]MDE1317726.1 LysR substrate-binding domain-containing protein [Vibrio aestuarianus]CAH8242690.1 LysR family transcriptional regulator [Vibrio aestuarianus]